MKDFYTANRKNSGASYRPINFFEEYENKPHSKSKPATFSCNSPLNWATAICIGLLALVFCQQYWIIRHHFRPCPNKLLSSNGLSLALDREYRASVPTTFTSPDLTEAHEAWGAVEAGHGDVLIDPEYAAERDLPPSIPHPRNPNKLLYIIESYHAIHCIKRLRTHYFSLMRGEPPFWPLEHDEHYFDTLRQNAMCWASDTLLYTTGNFDAGVNQTRFCRN